MKHLKIYWLVLCFFILGTLLTVAGEAQAAETVAVSMSIERTVGAEQVIRKYTTQPVRTTTRSAATSIHRVSSGETLSQIAARYNIDMVSLMDLNNLKDPNTIFAGQVLQIAANYQPYIVAAGESLWVIAHKFGVTLAELQANNNLVNPELVKVGQTIWIPLKQRNAVTVSRSSTFTERFSWPLLGVITSPFGPRHGEFHKGVDIAAGQYETITSARSGRIEFAGWCGNYGRCVVIDHGGDVKTRYAHAVRLLVSKGQWVSQGKPIALVGSTGRSTGPHLHFEIIINNDVINPINYLPQR